MKLSLVGTFLAVVALTFSAANADAKTKSSHACTATKPTPGWGMVGPDRRYVPLDKRLALYKGLGLGWVRVSTSVPPGGSAMTSIDEVSAFRSAGLKTFLTVEGLRFRMPGAIDQDYNIFASNLKWMVEQYHPDMVVVENEVDNPPFSEPAQEYLREVKTACGVAHAEGIPCTDGGLTEKMMIVMVIQNYLAHGDVARANHYGHYLRLWYPMHFQLDPTGPALSQMIENAGAARASDILQGLRAAGADRVNLHWYIRPSNGYSPQEQQDLLNQVLLMLRAKTGLPIAGGEVGMDKPHGSDTSIDPTPFVAMMSQLANAGVSPLIVWNPGSGLFGANQNGRSLVDAQGNLLVIGNAYGKLTHSRSFPDGYGGACK